MTETEMRLAVLHGGAAVRLSSICEEYFGLTYQDAAVQKWLNTLPVPAWAVTSSRQAPLLVHISDLAKFVDSKAKAKDLGLDAFPVSENQIGD